MIDSRPPYSKGRVSVNTCGMTFLIVCSCGSNRTAVSHSKIAGHRLPLDVIHSDQRLVRIKMAPLLSAPVISLEAAYLCIAASERERGIE
jgi:hypothetical protein